MLEVVALLDYPSRVMIANALGYMSIGCWLCAQLPQVIKNASLKSCEGLALPFLCSWLFGDITNLIGCLLTDQLPFQTYLAIYFCAIDLALVGQFIHYKPKQTRIPISNSANQTPRYVSYSTLISSPHQSLILPPSTAPPLSQSNSNQNGYRTRSSSTNLVVSSVPNTSRPSKPKRQYTNSHLYLPPDINVTSSSPSAGYDGTYQAIYEAALDVARAAERASQNRRSKSAKRRKLSLSRQISTTNVNSNGNGMNEDEYQNGPNENLIDSIHSDLSDRSSSTIGGVNRMTQSTGTLLGDNRGRSMTRTTTRSPMGQLSPLPNHDGLDGLPSTSSTLGLILGNQNDLQIKENKRNASRSLSLARGSGGRGGRRAAGVAFMSLGLLVGYGNLGGSSYGISRTSQSVGRVLLEPTNTISNPYIMSYQIPSPSDLPGSVSADKLEISNLQNIQNNHITKVIIPQQSDGNDSPHIPPPPHIPEDPPSFQRIVGRISAWACTNLYLASRLPQIWKNFQRKSVEGLSILLFAMAFLGNLTYVSSILLNPAGNGDPNEAGHYLLEALPYLLGSGGTLVFDLTIMIQSIIYGSSPPMPIPQNQIDRSSRRRGYFTSKRKLKHVEDGHHHTHNHNHNHNHIHSHTRSHSYSQTQSNYHNDNNNNNNNNERTPLLPPFNEQPNGLGIIGIESNRQKNKSSSKSRSRTRSPDKLQSQVRSLSRKRDLNDDNDQ
ncbi:uncharacterized protein L201_004882 [Kwoniella dendrophila CBS 6074]|uniref:Vacuolar membrane protein n=1 Tax=Kwoniella dendrophila CBS 6074 TaxID=1295534 RepID=A0AAX4JZK6_9TREE